MAAPVLTMRAPADDGAGGFERLRAPADDGAGGIEQQMSPLVASSGGAPGRNADRSRRRKDLLLDDEVLLTSSAEGRAYSIPALFMYYACVVATAGLAWLVGRWSAKSLARALSVPAAPADADFFIVDGADGSFEICPIEPVGLETEELRASRSSCACGPLLPRHRGLAVADRMFVYRHSRFLWSAAAKTYVLLTPEDFTPPSTLAGLGSKEAAARLHRGGANVIDLPIPPGVVLFFREAIHPFFIFQLWAVIVWCTESYYGYSVFIFCTAVGTAYVNYLDVSRNLEEVRRLSHYTTPVTVVRDGTPLVVDSAELVAGDVIHITHGLRLPCDVVLVSGQATVTEAMLTGETTVVTKVPLDAFALHVADSRNTLFGGTNVAELRVAKGQPVLAVVARTAWESVKGRLVLSILYPRPIPFKFMRESVIFIALLFGAAMIGFGINAWQMRLDCVDDDGELRECTGEEIGYIIQRGCDMVTIVVPPALPLALTVGVIYAVSALRKDNLFCISPPKINLAGKINAVCFDKTGTLTADSLKLSAVHAAVGGAFTGAVKDAGALPGEFNRLLACCHSLTHVGATLAGDPLEMQTFAFTGAAFDEPHTPGGADLAAKMAATPSLSARVTMRDGWVGHVVGVFEFQAALQRMGVLVEAAGGAGAGGVTSFVKGAPEAIVALCAPASVPADFPAVLASYTKLGFRVLAAASKPYSGPLPMPGSDASSLRAGAEAGLTFLGLIVLDNPLKPQSGPTVARLRSEAGAWMAMVTGDNPVAAVCIARQCKLVEDGFKVYIGDADGDGGVAWRDADDDAAPGLDPVTLLPLRGASAGPYRLAMTGRAFAVLQSFHAAARARYAAAAPGGGAWAPGKSPPNAELDAFPRAVLNTAVFARMSPDAKAQLVEAVQATGMYVLMIGDGANDALALRAAHVGISLSQVEASVAAPFTYAVPDPSVEAVPLLLAEGRGALTTSFCMFQFMALYSTIQFANALLIVFASSFLSNSMYLYQDLFIVFVLALVLGNTPAARVLTFKRPSGRLFSGQNLLLTFGFIALTFGLQAHVFLQVRKQAWYDTDDYPATMQYDDPDAFNYDYEGTNSGIPETTSVFLMATLQYSATAAIFSIGAPYKLSTFKNPLFVLWLVFTSICGILLFFAVEDWVYWVIGMQVLPSDWLRDLFGWSVLSFAMYFVWWGILVAARHRGVLRAVSTAWCSRRDAQHKRLRGEWRRQLGLPARAPPAGTAAATAPAPAV
jgi:cation-transporting P-type ATPase 13A2